MYKLNFGDKGFNNENIYPSQMNAAIIINVRRILKELIPPPPPGVLSWEVVNLEI